MSAVGMLRESFPVAPVSERTTGAGLSEQPLLTADTTVIQ